MDHYLTGKLLKKVGDNDQAKTHLAIASDEGHAIAPFILGNIYSDEAEYEKSMKWFHVADKLGNSDAQLELARIYMFGYSLIDQDKEKAIEFYEKSSENGNARAQTELAWFYIFSTDEKFKDDTRAAMWYTKAANNGYPKAQYELGNTIYANGWGIDKDDNLALEWIEKAANNGYIVAQYKLGNMYYKGVMVTENKTTAAKWFNSIMNRDIKFDKHIIDFLTEFNKNE